MVGEKPLYDNHERAFVRGQFLAEITDSFNETMHWSRPASTCGLCLEDISVGRIGIEAACFVTKKLNKQQQVLFDVWLEKWQK